MYYFIATWLGPGCKHSTLEYFSCSHDTLPFHKIESILVVTFNNNAIWTIYCVHTYLYNNRGESINKHFYFILSGNSCRLALIVWSQVDPTSVAGGDSGPEDERRPLWSRDAEGLRHIRSETRLLRYRNYCTYRTCSSDEMFLTLALGPGMVRVHLGTVLLLFWLDDEQIQESSVGSYEVFILNGVSHEF